MLNFTEKYTFKDKNNTITQKQNIKQSSNDNVFTFGANGETLYSVDVKNQNLIIENKEQFVESLKAFASLEGASNELQELYEKVSSLAITSPNKKLILPVNNIKMDLKLGLTLDMQDNNGIARKFKLSGIGLQVMPNKEKEYISVDMQTRTNFFMEETEVPKNIAELIKNKELSFGNSIGIELFNALVKEKNNNLEIKKVKYKTYGHDNERIYGNDRNEYAKNKSIELLKLGDKLFVPSGSSAIGIPITKNNIQLVRVDSDDFMIVFVPNNKNNAHGEICLAGLELKDVKQILEYIFEDKKELNQPFKYSFSKLSQEKTYLEPNAKTKNNMILKVDNLADFNFNVVNNDFIKNYEMEKAKMENNEDEIINNDENNQVENTEVENTEVENTEVEEPEVVDVDEVKDTQDVQNELDNAVDLDEQNNNNQYEVVPANTDIDTVDDEEEGDSTRTVYPLEILTPNRSQTTTEEESDQEVVSEEPETETEIEEQEQETNETIAVSESEEIKELQEKLKAQEKLIKELQEKLKEQETKTEKASKSSTGALLANGISWAAGLACMMVAMFVTVNPFLILFAWMFFTANTTVAEAFINNAVKSCKKGIKDIKTFVDEHALTKEEKQIRKQERKNKREINKEKRQQKKAEKERLKAEKLAEKERLKEEKLNKKQNKKKNLQEELNEEQEEVYECEYLDEEELQERMGNAIGNKQQLLENKEDYLLENKDENLLENKNDTNLLP